MTTWTLVILLGSSAVTVPNIESATACLDAGKQVTAKSVSAAFVCVETRAPSFDVVNCPASQGRR